MRGRTDERGFAVVIAILVIGISLSLGLAAFAHVRRETSQSGQERVRDSAFNLSEDVLDATVTYLGNHWPTSGSPYPSSCTQASTSSTCPSPTGVSSAFTGAGAPVDFNGSWSWSTEVHDNGTPTATYYSDSTSSTKGQPGYDANGDSLLWVRAQGVVSGRKRTLVSLVQIEQIRTTFPANVVTSGWFQTTNNGKKTIVNTEGNPAGAPGTLAVRCNVGGSSYPNTCLNYNPSKGQVYPDTKQDNYAGGSALSASDLALMKARAQSLGSYYTGCPASMTGGMVYVEGPSTCSYNGSTYNAQGSPGVFIIANGTLSLGGNATYYGLVYAANLQNSTAAVVSLSGNAQIVGSIAVDGAGGASIGSSGNNLVFDRNVFSNVIANGFVTQIQNGWREIASP